MNDAGDDIEAMRRVIAQGSYAMSPGDRPYQDVAERLYHAGFGTVPREAMVLGNPSPVQVDAALRRFYGEGRAAEMWDRREDMRAALLAAATAEPLLLSPVDCQYGVQYPLSTEADGPDAYGYHVARSEVAAHRWLVENNNRGVIVRRVAAGEWQPVDQAWREGIRNILESE